MVKHYNQIIGKELFKKMISKQLKTNRLESDWVDNLPKLLEKLNKKAKPRVIKTELPKCKGDACKLLEKGTKVRVQLDASKETTGEKLAGRFRSHDIRWDPVVRVIKEVLIKPKSPPMYLLDGHTGKQKVSPVAYTKNQLQVVK
jgi:hypothetical protein